MLKLPAWFALAGLALYCTSGADGQVSPHAPAMLTQGINEKVLVALPGNVRPEASSAKDQGPVADSLELEHMFLQLKRPPAQEAALSSFLEDLHDPLSPNFHHWITAQEFGERFGIAKSDLDAVTSWLHSHGFTVHGVYPNLAIDFSGTAGQVRSAFHTQLHELVVNGERHFGNAADPQIPEALAPLVAGISSLHDFMPRSLAHRARRTSGPVPEFSAGAGYLEVVPEDLATIYNLKAAF
ncbi:MAG: peptidase S53, partial [Acidobacteriaceae bacterium]|nr:peptidase S53 [Acidobacteriaceae bacterium]